MSMRGAARVVHAFPTAAVVSTSVVLVAVVSEHQPNPLFLARVALAVLLTQIPVGALNDIVDRHDDALVQPDKPIPSGEISVGEAAMLAVVSLVLLVPAALSFGVLSLVLLITGTFGGLLYDVRLKRSPLSFAAYMIGFLSLLTWIWLVAGALSWRVVLLYPVAAALVIGAHLAQSYPDIETDRMLGHRGVAVVLGVKRTRRLVLTLYTALLIASTGAVLWRAPIGLLPVAASTVLALAAMLQGENHASRVRFFHLVAPALALLAAAAVVAAR